MKKRKTERKNTELKEGKNESKGRKNMMKKRGEKQKGKYWVERRKERKKGITK